MPVLGNIKKCNLGCYLNFHIIAHMFENREEKLYGIPDYTPSWSKYIFETSLQAEKYVPEYSNVLIRTYLVQSVRDIRRDIECTR